MLSFKDCSSSGLVGSSQHGKNHISSSKTGCASLLGKLYVLKRAIILKINTVLEKYKIKKCNLDFFTRGKIPSF